MNRRPPLLSILAVVALAACTKLVEPAADPGPSVDDTVVVADEGTPSDAADVPDPGPKDVAPDVSDPGPADPGRPDTPPDEPEAVQDDGPEDVGGGAEDVADEPEVCVPNCEPIPPALERECGPDGCGSICGYCKSGYACDTAGTCQLMCVPKCYDQGGVVQRWCGDDSCGGSCGDCALDFECREDYRCYPKECVPDCLGKECGDDGCGDPDACGTCPMDYSCSAEGTCALGPCKGVKPGINKCQDKRVLLTCVDGGTRLEQTDCSAKPPADCGQWGCECNYDGWNSRWDCVQKPQCIPDCTLDDPATPTVVEKKECGDDGCGGQSCAVCPNGWGCAAHYCRAVVGAECGWVGEKGYCSRDNWLYTCDPLAGKIVSVTNCATEERKCGWDPARQQMDCLLL